MTRLLAGLAQSRRARWLALIALGAVVMHLVRIMFVLGFASGNVETQLATLEEIEASYLESHK